MGTGGGGLKILGSIVENVTPMSDGKNRNTNVEGLILDHFRIY